MSDSEKKILKKRDECVLSLKEMNIELVKDLSDDNLSLLHDLLTLSTNGPVRTVIKHDLSLLVQKILGHKYPALCLHDHEEGRHPGGA